MSNMIKHICRRLCVGVFLLLGVSLFTFYLMHVTPGNFFDSLKMNPQISQETVARYERLYHLEQPLLVQYGYWISNVLKGDWGYSFFYNVPVTRVMGSRLWNTFVLSLASLILTWAVGIPLGIWAALRHNQWPDKVISFLSYAAFSMPGFFLLMLMLFTASQWGVLPLGGMHSARYEDLSWWQKILDVGAHLIIPTVALSLASIASLQKIMRGNMLAVLQQQYILAARAKGLSERRVIYVHALRNAFNPLATLLGYEFAALLSGAALIEIMCSWPGIGSLLLTAVRSKDVYVVMASLLLGGGLLIVGNILADLLLFWLDPRIRDGKR